MKKIIFDKKKKKKRLLIEKNIISNIQNNENEINNILDSVIPERKKVKSDFKTVEKTEKDFSKNVIINDAIKKASENEQINSEISIQNLIKNGKQIYKLNEDSFIISLNDKREEFAYQKCKIPEKIPIFRWYQWIKKIGYSKEIKEQKIRKKYPDKVVLIKMEMSNGMFREILVLEDLGGFVFNKKQYVFDYTMKYFIIERNIWAYDFSEYLTLPYRRKKEISELTENIIARLEYLKQKGSNEQIEGIYKQLEERIGIDMRSPIFPHVNINEIKTLIENSNIVDVETSLNPLNAKRFIDSEAIKQALQAVGMNRFLKIIMIVLVVLGGITLIGFMITLWHTGVFDKLSHMFKRG